MCVCVFIGSYINAFMSMGVHFIYICIQYIQDYKNSSDTKNKMN